MFPGIFGGFFPAWFLLLPTFSPLYCLRLCSSRQVLASHIVTVSTSSARFCHKKAARPLSAVLDFNGSACTLQSLHPDPHRNVLVPKSTWATLGSRQSLTMTAFHFLPPQHLPWPPSSHCWWYLWAACALSRHRSCSLYAVYTWRGCRKAGLAGAGPPTLAVNLETKSICGGQHHSRESLSTGGWRSQQCSLQSLGMYTSNGNLPQCFALTFLSCSVQEWFTYGGCELLGTICGCKHFEANLLPDTWHSKSTTRERTFNYSDPMLRLRLRQNLELTNDEVPDEQLLIFFPVLIHSAVLSLVVFDGWHVFILCHLLLQLCLHIRGCEKQKLPCIIKQGASEAKRQNMKRCCTVKIETIIEYRQSFCSGFLKTAEVQWAFSAMLHLLL